MDIKSHETLIEQGLNSVADSIVTVGKSLEAIRDEKLYRPDYRSFRQYVMGRWGFKAPHAYHLIDAANVIEKLMPHFAKEKLPQTASAVRPMTKLKPEQMVPVWERVLALSNRPGRVGRGTVVQAIDDLGLAA